MGGGRGIKKNLPHCWKLKEEKKEKKRKKMEKEKEEQ